MYQATASDRPRGPLQGVRVLELGSTVAAPFCGRLMADFGAEVIKVEPFQGDTVRTMGRRKAGRSLYAASIFRNKRLLALDLTKEAGREIVRQLTASSDVVIENFKPGKLEEWGLGYESLARANPGLILVRISGYGQSGPYRLRVGYGVTCEAVSGLRELTGDPDRAPARVAVSLTDEIAGLYGALGAVMAIHVRERTGRGQVVDTALYEAAFSMIEPHVPAFGSLRAVPTRAGSRLPGSAPNNLYPSSDGGFIHITAITNALFGRLAKLMGRPELATDPRFAEAESRCQNEVELDRIIAAWTATLATTEAEQRLLEADIPAARIYRLPDIFSDDHFAAREMLVKLADPELGKVVVAGVVPKLSETPGELRTAGGRVGENTREILSEVLHLSGEDIRRLEQAGVVRAAPEHLPQAVSSTREGAT